MSKLSGWWTRCQRAVRRGAFERQMAEEMQLHQEMEAARLAASGHDPADSARRAALAFGHADSYREAVRDRRLGAWAEAVYQDVRYAVRWLRRSPVFATVAIATLAIGIGANTAIFSVLDRVLLQPLPYPEADRLVLVFETLPSRSLNSPSGGAFLDWRDQQTRFEALAITGQIIRNLRTPDGPERLQGGRVSHEFLRVLGVTPALGRGFLPEEDAPGGNNQVVLLTDGLWRSRFGGRQDVVGETLVLDDVPHTVIGVLPPRAWVRQEEQFFVPAVAHASQPDFQRAPHWSNVFGRLKPGVTPEQAELELQTIKQRLAAQYPEWKARWSVAVQPLQPLLVRTTRPVLWLLMAAVGLVLLIACLNLASLLAARATERQHEMALRGALGASRARLVRQVLTESLVLAALGGGGGLLLAHWGIGILARFGADALPPMLVPTLDGRVLVAALLLTGGTGLLFGSLPAWRLRDHNLDTTLRNGGKGGTTAGTLRAQAGLVVGQIALAVVLLVSAGVLGRSLVKAASREPGFDAQQALAFDLTLPDGRYDTPEKRLEAARLVLDELRRVPGIEAAGAGLAAPGTGGGYGERIWPAGRPATEEDPLGRFNAVTPGYFEALRARLLAGRFFTASDDRADGVGAIVVNETLARRLFGTEPAVGHVLNASGDEGPWRIIGVVADLPYDRLDGQAPPTVYAPFADKPESFTVVLRSALAPSSLAPLLRQQISRLDDSIAVANMRVLEQTLQATLGSRRMVLALISLFSLLALLLTTVGLYGVMAYRVAQRRREFAIRLAIGAAPGAVVRLAMRGGLKLVTLGIAAGAGGAAAATILLRSQLYQVQPYDPGAFTGAILLLGGVALAACWWPARRSARCNPAEALRAE